MKSFLFDIFLYRIIRLTIENVVVLKIYTVKTEITAISFLRRTRHRGGSSLEVVISK